MDIKPLRTHPKMTKNLLDQIDTLQRSNHTSDEIASTLGITPEAVERGFDKLSERRRAEIHATKGGAFAAVAKSEKRRPLCTETACPGAVIRNTASGRAALRRISRLPRISRLGRRADRGDEIVR